MENQNKKNPQKRPLNTIVEYSGLGIQMGVTIYLGVKLGEWLDVKYPNEKGWFTIGCTLASVGLSMASLIVKANKMNKE